MDLAPFRASVEELRRERGRAVEELNAAKERVTAAEAKLALLDRTATDLEAVLHEAQADEQTEALPLAGLPPTANGVGLMVTAASVAVGMVQQHAKRNRDRNELILKVMESGPRDWDVGALVDEMSARGWTKGLTQPDAAIRVALDRMASKSYRVVKMGPRTYRLMSRLAEPDRKEITL